MDLESKELRRCVGQLKEIDFELEYLALLTYQGLKPLSRWEKPLDDHGLELLQQMGLLTKQIRRTVKTGKVVLETIFSISPGYIQVYEKQFAGKPIDKSAATVRFEGFLFGFPPCCVDEYIRHPYIKMPSLRSIRKFCFTGPVRIAKSRQLFCRDIAEYTIM